jgi:hypothetical protein
MVRNHNPACAEKPVQAGFVCFSEKKRNQAVQAIRPGLWAKVTIIHSSRTRNESASPKREACGCQKRNNVPRED